MPRGPKPKTVKNSRRRLVDTIKINDLIPTADLDADATDEFLRLARVLSDQGRLDNVDVGVMTMTAQDKALMDRMNRLIAREEGFPDEKHITARNGVRSKWYTGMRSLGLTVLPSRSLVKTTAKSTEPGSKWGDKLKVVGN